MTMFYYDSARNDNTWLLIFLYKYTQNAAVTTFVSFHDLLLLIVLISSCSIYGVWSSGNHVGEGYVQILILIVASVFPGVQVCNDL